MKSTGTVSLMIFVIPIQIRGKFRVTVIVFLDIKLQKMYMTPQPSCSDRLVTIWERNEIFSKFELWWKNHKRNGPQDMKNDTVNNNTVYGTTWSYCETVILWNSLCVWFCLTTAVESPFHIGCAFSMCTGVETVKQSLSALKQTRNCFTVSMHTTTMQTNNFWN